MYRFHPSRGSIALTERIKRLVLMAFILVSVPVYVFASQLTGIPIPQGNVLQQLVTGQSYNVTCTGAGVYFRGWTGTGGGNSLQNNCGAGFSQSLSPAVYQFSVQDSSGFNTIETFNVEVVTSNYCQNGAGDYPTCTPPVSGCMDSRAINYVASSTINTSCLYPFKSNTQGWTEPFFRFGVGNSLMTPSVTGFHYATETFSGTPYIITTSSVTDVDIALRYSFSSSINTLYYVGTAPLYAGNYVRGCGGQYLGGGTTGVSAVGQPFLTPDEIQVQVYKVVVTPSYYNCVEFASFVQTPAAPSGMRIYSIWTGANEIAVPTTYTEVVTQSQSITVGATPTYVASSTLPDCGLTDIGCHMANAFSYVFTPDPNAINRFKSLSLASSSPFAYAYDMKNVYTEFFSTASSAELGLTVTTGIGAITFISKAKVEAVPYAGFVKTLIGWLLWFMFANLVYNQILKVHNKELTT